MPFCPCDAHDASLLADTTYSILTLHAPLSSCKGRGHIFDVLLGSNSDPIFLCSGKRVVDKMPFLPWFRQPPATELLTLLHANQRMELNVCLMYLGNDLISRDSGRVAGPCRKDGQ